MSDNPLRPPRRGRHTANHKSRSGPPSPRKSAGRLRLPKRAVHRDPPPSASVGSVPTLPPDLALSLAPLLAGGPETKQLLRALTAYRKGDFTVRLPEEWAGVNGRVAEAFNEVVELNQRMAKELERLTRTVGKEGKLGERGVLGDVGGSWSAAIGCVNQLIGDLVHPVAETARVIGAVAKGDLSQTMGTEVEGRPLQGEFLRTAKTVNTMVDQLSSFASEVTRVAREVGTEGKLGGQAKVKGVAGTWKDLTDNVNLMA